MVVLRLTAYGLPDLPILPSIARISLIAALIAHVYKHVLDPARCGACDSATAAAPHTHHVMVIYFTI